MKNKIIALLLLLHPIVVWSLCFRFDLEFYWFLDDNFKFFDLLYSSISFVAFSLGLWLLTPKVRVYIILAFWMMFVFDQTVTWGFSNNRYLSKIELNSDVSLALIRYDFGAVSSDNFVKLEKFERKLLFFVTRKELKQFLNVKKANISLSGEMVSIDIIHYNNNKTHESIKLKEL